MLPSFYLYRCARRELGASLARTSATTPIPMGPISRDIRPPIFSEQFDRVFKFETSLYIREATCGFVRIATSVKIWSAGSLLQCRLKQISSIIP